MSANGANMVTSYRALRFFVGVLGLALPPVLIVGGYFAGDGFLKTLSTYYHSESPLLRGYFVGTLSAGGAFLVCYKGYDSRDNWVANVAGFGALFAAIFPTSMEDCSPLSCAEMAFSNVHDISTLVFLAASTAMVLCQFRKTGTKPMTIGKAKRNCVYTFCGAFMLVGTAALTILSLVESNIPYILLIVESLVILAFGAAWLVKALNPWESCTAFASPNGGET
ncbi:MAG: DUF998 domain-containing protein [Rhodospirillaceae bacterium]|nr:DUF998 domain-containing protein [Rhodospirillaceae bacterium]MYB13271.1 DUF998 domain-containing protein [Rhodospirillaceae bacterium]MYI50989.1 DUF998 domain-containing protein [Rhodospirillaceae bacterium]